MNRLILITLLLYSTFSASAQNKYLVEYDRLSGNINYYELIYSKGKYTEVEIKQPTVSKGDFVQFRTLNTNPFVFSMSLQPPLERDQSKSASSSVFSGFASIMGEMDNNISDLGYQLSNLTRFPPTKPEFVRGEMTAQEVLKNEQLQKLALVHNHLVQAMTVLESYANSLDILESEELTKEEMLNQLQSSIRTFNGDEYKSLLREIDKEVNQLSTFNLIDSAEVLSMMDSYNFLSEKLNGSVLNPEEAEELLLMVENANFSQLDATVVAMEQGYGSAEVHDLSEKQNVEYVIQLRGIDEDVDEKFRDDNLKQQIAISLPVSGGVHCSWATGVYGLNAFKGIRSFQLNTVSYDSVRIDEKKVESLRFALGTSLLIEFPNKSFLVPNISIGAAMGLVTDAEGTMSYPVSFLLGGGVKLEKFPFIALNAGLSFCESRTLKNGFTSGQVLENSTYGQNDISRKSFLPGYFIGLNITF
jgi:hypothetical protein